MEISPDLLDATWDLHRSHYDFVQKTLMVCNMLSRFNQDHVAELEAEKDREIFASLNEEEKTIARHCRLCYVKVIYAKNKQIETKEDSISS